MEGDDMATQRIYALFQDVADAERAIGALTDRGIPKDQIGVAARRTAEEDETHHVRAGFTRLTDGQDQLQGEPVVAYEAQPGTLPPAALAGTVKPTSTVDTSENVEDVGKGGITTTTPEDAAAGAAVGAGIGLIAGIAAAAAVLIIPGVGPILAGGVLASAFGVAAGTTVAGAAVGGTVGYLVDMGMPEHAATHFADRLHEGDYLVTAIIEPEQYDDVKQILMKYNAAGVDLGEEIAGEGISVARSDNLLTASQDLTPVPIVNSVPVTSTEGTHIITEQLDGTPIVPAIVVDANGRVV
jgi:hypothetical protein